MTKIIQNAILCADGTILNSVHVHDFQKHPTESTFIDGGRDYLRHGGSMLGVSSLILFEDDSVNACINNMLWGTYGKYGKDPLKWVFLKDCETEHLQAILDTQKQISPKMKEVIEGVLASRKNHKLTKQIIENKSKINIVLSESGEFILPKILGYISYEFPEHRKHRNKQKEWFVEVLNKQTEPIFIYTFSDTFVSFLGAAIDAKKINKEDVKIFLIENDEVKISYFDDGGVLINWPFGWFEADFYHDRVKDLS